MTNFVITDFLYIIYGPLDGAKVKIIGPALGSLLLIIIASGLEEIFLFVLKPKLEQEKKLAGIHFQRLLMFNLDIHLTKIVTKRHDCLCLELSSGLC